MCSNDTLVLSQRAPGRNITARVPFEPDEECRSMPPTQKKSTLVLVALPVVLLLSPIID